MNLLTVTLGTISVYFRSTMPEPIPDHLVSSIPIILASPYPVIILYIISFSTLVYNPYSILPPHLYLNKWLNANKISQFIKIYNKEKKYTKDLYDLIDNKIRIFLNFCYYMDI